MSRTSVRSEQVRDQNILVDDLRDFAVITNSGLNVDIKAGRIRNDNVITDKIVQTLAMSDNNTNYVELNTAGVASSNTTGFTAGRVPLATVVTSSGAVTTITDKRSWVIVDNNSGGSGTPPGTLSDTTKDLWIALARTKIIEDQTASRSANEVWSLRTDVFTDGSGIDDALSVDYTLRGTPNYDVTIISGSLDLFRPANISSGLQANYKLGAPTQLFMATAGGSLDTSIKKFGAGSYNNNDAGNNYLGWGNRTDLASAFGTNWTVEMFVYFDNATNDDRFCVIGQVNPANDTNFQVSNYLSFGKGTSGIVSASWTINGVAQGTINHQNTATSGQWYHVAFVKNGSVETLYLDGVASSTTLNVNTSWTGASAIIFGTNNSNSGGDHLDGRVDEFRISTVARYTTAFTPTTSAFTADADTRSLIHFDSSNWIDEGMPDYLEKDYSVNGNHLTNNNTVATSADDYWNTDEVSADFESGNSEYLSITDAAQTGLDMTGSITFACWKKAESNPSTHYMCAKGEPTNGYAFAFDSLRVMFMTINGSTYGISAGSAETDGKWNHYAWVFDSVNDLALFYINGNLDKVISGATATPGANSSDFFIGAKTAVTGYMDGLLKDSALWNTVLTPLQIKSLALGVDLSTFAYRPSNVSTAPTANWKLNELSAGAGAVSRADSAGSHTLTDNNTVTTNGGYIEGAGARFTTANSEFLTAADSADWDFGTGDFSWATWVNIKQTSIWNALIAPTGTFVGSTDWFMVAIDDGANGGTLTVYTESTSAVVSNTITNFKVDTWYHLAVCRRSGTLYIYLDGVQIHSVANTVDIQSPGAIDLGHWFSGGTHYYANVIMQDMAIWKGYGVTAAEVASLASGLPLQSQGITSHWKLNETSGNRTDSIGANTLTDNNTVTSASGKVGNAADFELSNSEYLTLSSAGDFACATDREWTFGVWLNFESHSAEAYLANLADSVNNLSISKQTTGGGRWDLALGGATFSTTVPTTVGSWEHVIITKRGTTWELHVQSSLRNTQAQSGAITASGTLNIGRTNAGSLYYDGLMDEMFLAKRGLRSEEVKAIYNKGLNGKEITSSEISPASSATVISTAFTVSEAPDRALLITNKTLNDGSITFYVSRVSSPGTNLADTTKWTPITENTITNISGQNTGTSCRWAAVLEDGAELDDIAVVFGLIGGSGGGSGGASTSERHFSTGLMGG